MLKVKVKRQKRQCGYLNEVRKNQAEWSHDLLTSRSCRICDDPLYRIAFPSLRPDAIVQRSPHGKKRSRKRRRAILTACQFRKIPALGRFGKEMIRKRRIFWRLISQGRGEPWSFPFSSQSGGAIASLEYFLIIKAALNWYFRYQKQCFKLLRMG